MDITQIAARKSANDRVGATLQKRIHDAQAKGSPEALIRAVESDFKAWKNEHEFLIAEKAKADGAEAMMRKMGGNFGSALYAGTKSASNTPQLVSPLSVPASAYEGLYEAVQKRLPSFRVEFDGTNTKSMSPVNVSTKAPFAETGFSSGGLPPVLMPGLTQSLAYEPDRMFAHFIQTPTPAASSVEYIVHTGNTLTASPVPELGQKPDLGMILTTRTTPFTKVAALASISTEAIMDFPTFVQFVPAELTHAIFDAETNQVVNGNGSSPNMLGLLNTPGVLTRSVGSDTNIDAIRKSFNDIRVGSSYGNANLVCMNPTTWASLSLAKATTGAYLLNPDDPNAIGDLHSIFGAQVITNTYIPAGTAIVMDSTRAVLGWTRMGLTIDLNGYGSNEFDQNYCTFRAEERIAIGVQRPTALNIVTGLPTT
jgi:hypothetical protein